MAIRSNRFFNSPQMAQAAANLASLFEPPSGADEAGYARARADDQQTGMIKAMWDYSQSPEFDPEIFDRGGIISNLYDWTGSKYGVDTGAATQRYGYDTQAATTRATNAADNARALQSARETALLQPIGANETQFRPQSIVELFDVPESQTGVVSAAQGETLLLPSGETVMGQAKPLSFEEWKAQEAAKSMDAGLISPQDVADIVMGGQELVDVVVDGKPVKMTRGAAVRRGLQPLLSSDQQKALQIDEFRNSGKLADDLLIQSIMGGGQPVKVVNRDGSVAYMSPAAAAAAGATPYLDPGSQAKPTNALAVLGNGVRVPAVQGPDNKWYNAQTGAALPADIQIFDMPKPQGTSEEVGLTASNVGNINQQLIDLSTTRDTAIRLRNLIAKSPASQGAVGWLRGTVQNVVAIGGELGDYFGGPVQEMADEVNRAIDAGIADPDVMRFDKDVPAIEMLANLLAYKFARVGNSDGRLSNEDVRAARTALGLEGLTANQASSLARLDQAIESIEAQEETLTRASKQGVGSLRSRAPAPASEADVEDWVPDGQGGWRRATR